MQRFILLLTATFLATGCGGGDEQAGGVTAEEARKLDEAAEMLDASPDALLVDAGNSENGEQNAVAGSQARPKQ